MHYSLDKREDISSRIAELEKHVDELRDDNIRYRRTMEDMLCNLTLENMPAVRAALEATAVTPSLVTGYLYSSNARIADITCLRLRTDYDKPARYLASDRSPLRYLHIHDSVCEFITASAVEPDADGSVGDDASAGDDATAADGVTTLSADYPTEQYKNADGVTTLSADYPTEQYKNADGAAVYWTDDEHTAMTVEETEWPVTVYRYDERVDISFSFDEYMKMSASESASGTEDGAEDESSSLPELTVTAERDAAPSLLVGGADGEGKIDRRGDSLNISLSTDAHRSRVSLLPSGLADVTRRRASLHLSEEDGRISVTPEGAGTDRPSLLSGAVSYDILTESDTATGTVKLIYPDGGEFSFGVDGFSESLASDGSEESDGIEETDDSEGSDGSATTASEWSRRELLTAAVGISLGIPWTDTRPSFAFVINVKRANYTFTTSSASYPLVYDGCLTVDWGDGVREDFRDGTNPSHVYAAAGSYTVIYRGCIKTMRFTTNTVLTEVLTALPYTMTAGFDSCFLRCTALTTIPENLFDDVTPDGDLGLYATFRQSNITAVPERLFDRCASLTNLSYTFWGCRKNTAIPERLFESLRSPRLLYGTFCGNSSFKGWLPEAWERFPSADGTGCFGACSGALNYSAVPTLWRKSVT